MSNMQYIGYCIFILASILTKKTVKVEARNLFKDHPFVRNILILIELIVILIRYKFNYG